MLMVVKENRDRLRAVAVVGPDVSDGSLSTPLVDSDRGMAALVRIDADDHHGPRLPLSWVARTGRSAYPHRGDGGRVIADGSPEDLKHRVGGSYCEVKPVNPADLKRIAMALAGFDGLEITDDAVSLPAPGGVATLGEVFRRVEALGVELTDISLRRPSLDEVFLKLTGDDLAAKAVG